MFDPDVARELVDALRLLEGRYASTGRRLLPGTRVVQAVAERSRAVTSVHPLGDDVDDMHDDPVLELLTFADVVRRTNLSESTVRRFVAAGELPVVRIGRSVRVKPDDLAAFIAALPAARRAS